ncbi:MAG TPA: ABC transporter ATP-binding protein [Acidimicrobiales bacterium]|nr:ABC transporter ATP-binding protein [Acidimicrobiales bacterium]
MDFAEERRPLPLEVENLGKTFRSRSRLRLFKSQSASKSSRERAALDSVSFHVPEGEIYGVLGANGSGKSTLVRILSTLLLPDRGTVRIFGHDVVKEPSAVRPLLNRVSVDPSFFKPMSAMENLLFFGRVYGLPGAEVRRASATILARLGLSEEHCREPMLHLSRGQQQKVAVARAFLSAPRLMLLDEPTTGLDPRSKREVQSFVAEVRREQGVTILLTTHDMDEAEALCDRIGFLSSGRLVAEGTPLELRKQVAAGRPLDEVDMETVFIELTGRSIEEDEEEDDAAAEAVARAAQDTEDGGGGRVRSGGGVRRGKVGAGISDDVSTKDGKVGAGISNDASTKDGEETEEVSP